MRLALVGRVACCCLWNARVNRKTMGHERPISSRSPDTVRVPRKPKRNRLCIRIALFILLDMQPTTADDTGATT